MIHRKGRSTDRQLLSPCVLGAGADRQVPATDDETGPCDSCPIRCSALEDTARYLADRVSGTWAGIDAAITARRNQLDDVLDRLAGIGADGGAEADRGRPIRTLVVSASERTRSALAGRMADDPRFALAGQAATPAAVVPLAATGLPDLVLVHLPYLARWSLEELADLGKWSPSSVVVVVSGLDAVRVGDLVMTSAVANNWPRREPSRSGGGGTRGGGARSAGRSADRGRGRVDPPRSIIQEAMRQIGVPMRRKS